MDVEFDAEAAGRAAANTWLRERRARRHEPVPPVRRRAAWIAVAAIHLALLAALWTAMQPKRLVPGPASDPFVVRFDVPDTRGVDPAFDVAPPRRHEPMVRPPASASVPGVAARAVVRTSPIAQRIEPPPRRIELFDRDGSLRLSPEVVAAAEPRPETTPLYRERRPMQARFMEHRTPIAYEPTIFELAWARKDENAVEEWIRLNTIEKTFKTPWGTKIKCAWSPVMLAMVGCAW